MPVPSIWCYLAVSSCNKGFRRAFFWFLEIAFLTAEVFEWPDEKKRGPEVRFVLM